jgi:hypothetical protein
MKKEINEKTFELNITSEILNLGRKFEDYIFESVSLTEGQCNDFSQVSSGPVIYCTGFTQKQEQENGCDVQIIYPRNKNGLERVIFLQYKSGYHRDYSTKAKSIFSSVKCNESGCTKKHVMFEFNNDSKKHQHLVLRAFSQSKEISEKSVMYAFPRITKESDFISKVGSLVSVTSFVSISAIDKKAEENNVDFSDEKPHKFRADYLDEKRSEVNYFFYYYGNDEDTIGFVIESLVVGVERAVHIARRIGVHKSDVEKCFEKYLRLLVNYLLDYRFDAINVDNIVLSIIMNDIDRLKGELDAMFYRKISILAEQLNPYVTYIYEKDVEEIPIAPSKYSNIIPEDGLRMDTGNSIDLDFLTYQRF